MLTKKYIVDLNIVQGQFVDMKLLNKILIDIDESEQPFSFFEMRESLGKDNLYFYVQCWINDLRDCNG